MRRPGYLRLRTAIASDTTHPMNVQPRNRLITRTDPTFGTLRDAAMIVGRKYSPAPSTRMMSSPTPAEASDPISVAPAAATLGVVPAPEAQCSHGRVVAA
jgi:hypothetical protein